MITVGVKSLPYVVSGGFVAQIKLQREGRVVSVILVSHPPWESGGFFGHVKAQEGK